MLIYSRTFKLKEILGPYYLDIHFETTFAACTWDTCARRIGFTKKSDFRKKSGENVDKPG